MLIGGAIGFLVGGHWGKGIAIGCLIVGICLLVSAHWPKKSEEQKPKSKTFDKPEGSVSAIREQRIFVSRQVEPYDLCRLYKGHTDIQAKKLLEPYIGKWMHIVGSISDMTFQERIPTDEIWITAVAPIKKDEKNAPTIFLRFDHQQWAERILTMKVGHKVKAIGKVESAESWNVSFIGCELE